MSSRRETALPHHPRGPYATLSVLRHGHLEDWPVVTAGKSTAETGAQVRFRHGRHYLKLRWDHATHTIHLTEVDGQRDGRTLEHFRQTDSAALVDSKLAAALAALDRGTALARRAAKLVGLAER